MKGKRQLLEALYEMADPIAEAEGLQVIDIEMIGKKDKPRIQIALFDPDGPGPTVGECQAFSDLLGARLDFEEDFLPGGFYLEVSSPGLERVLKKPREFAAFRGRQVQVRTYAPIDGTKEFYGTLRGIEGDHLLLEEEDQTRRIPRESISRTKLVYEA